MADSGMIQRPASHYGCESYVVTVKLSARAVKELKKMLKKEKTFHPFPKLPFELRSMIWKWAVYTQDRLVSFQIYPIMFDDPMIDIMDAPVPPLFLVNKEAYCETRSCYARLSGFITIDSQPAAKKGPLISFESDIFYYGSSNEHPLLMCDKPWPGYKRITELSDLSNTERCLQLLHSRGLRRLAMLKEAMTCRNVMYDCLWCCFSPLTIIETLAFMMDVDELRIIGRGKDNQISFTRKDLEPNDFKAQRNAKRSDRTQRFLQAVDQIQARVPRPKKGDLNRARMVMRIWNRGIIGLDLRHDRYLCQSKGGAMWKHSVQMSIQDVKDFLRRGEKFL